MKAKKEKDFDAVRMMREIRDNLSKETMNMNFEELKKYMNERLKKDQVLTDKKNVYLKLNPILESFRSVVSVRV
jgi:hypothetical protein